MWLKITQNYSPNFSTPKRLKKNIKYIIIHYTGMKNELSAHVPDELKQYVLDDNTVTQISYPVLEYPKKISSVKLSDKTPVIEGELRGIKGQYLLLDGGRVFNVRAHEGFMADFSHTQLAQQGVLF